MTLTTEEAAQLAGVEKRTIITWVHREHLAPVASGRRALRFREDDVWRCARERVPAGERARRQAAWVEITGGPA